MSEVNDSKFNQLAGNFLKWLIRVELSSTIGNCIFDMKEYPSLEALYQTKQNLYEVPKDFKEYYVRYLNTVTDKVFYEVLGEHFRMKGYKENEELYKELYPILIKDFRNEVLRCLDISTRNKDWD